MDETLSHVVVARLKQSGQLNFETLTEMLHVRDSVELDRVLNALLKQGQLKRSPRGLYYVPGHVIPSVRPAKHAAGGGVVVFGANTDTGRSISVDERVIKPGDCLTHKELKDVFQAGGIRGIRHVKASGIVLLISSIDNHVYRDTWQDGRFSYTGEGRRGDQQMAGGNLAIADSARTGTHLLLFFKRATSRYEFQGEVRLIGEPRTEVQDDEDGRPRRVFVFELEPISAG